MIVVSKFGGTSMGDAACMRRSATVSVARGASVVVVSATSGTTNQLIALGQAGEKGDATKLAQILSDIENKHRKIMSDLSCSPLVTSKVEKLFLEMRSLSQGIALLRDCSLKAMDVLMSLGERLSSEIFVTAMEEALSAAKIQKPVQWLDVREVLVTDDQFSKAIPQTDLIRANCVRQLNLGANIYVTQGFIGRSLTGHTTTLGRGGSDYSAAILAEGIGAQILEIWTDVAGIATTDPRLVPSARPIAEISFTEASELATFGAKVLHPATLLPALRQNIPVFVGSSFDPDQKGTWVRMQVKDTPLVRALALRRKQVLVTLTTPEMLQAHGFLARIFKVFNDHKVSVDSITTSEIGVALTLDDSALLNKSLLAELGTLASVAVEESLCLVSVIGNNINHTPGLARQIFDSIGDINVRMICLGASRHNFCFLVSEDQGPEALRRLHRTFCENRA